MANELTFKPGPSITISDTVKVESLLSSTGVANFLGIPYATVPARFRQCRLLDLESATPSDGGVLKATEYGPVCSQPGEIWESDRAFMLEGLRPLLKVNGKVIKSSEDCLRVNIHVSPETLVSGAKKLPVYAWIHGGGWTIGDGNTGADGNYLVRKAMDLGQLFDSIGINYRLGYHGFLSSKELEDEAKESGETYFANKGLHDQRVALLWIQKYIHHFGGDPDNVTIAGESAGGWCVLAHLLSNVPICKRGIIESTPIWTFPPLEDAQRTFDRMVASTGLPDSATGPEKLQALRALSDDEMGRLLNGVYSRPIWDPNWFVYQKDSSTPMERLDKFPSWVQGVMVGWTKDEMALWGCTQWTTMTPTDIITWIKDISPNPPFAEELMQVYHISEHQSQQSNFAALLKMSTELIYGCVPPLIGSHPTPKVWVFRFDQTDDFPQSAYRGYSYHSLDVAFVLCTPSVAGPEADSDYRQTSDRITEAWASFMCGESPGWGPFTETKDVMLFDGSRSRVIQWCEKDAVWYTLATSEEREDWLRSIGRKLLSKKRDL
ncbi:carboxylesterase, putative [Talaromyces stipitatus ATCC 10500]|uniref:Carboxylic ester hydrolase n=1 Tax=Talaromyces stipitatus (strain ATCC 10500 / CBS 375.48 / QM 6759 / NRRL 1006) TaxID=441959 RepID=B8M5D9_TALSN|nr:carboxylesterase, putative [Talaromyces stipitatus ATCC 10500]EED19745.1 carboxylesterase, putative [Talaromyces stipitatus ATCC 10500]